MKTKTHRVGGAVQAEKYPSREDCFQEHSEQHLFFSLSLCPCVFPSRKKEMRDESCAGRSPVSKSREKKTSAKKKMFRVYRNAQKTLNVTRHSFFSISSRQSNRRSPLFFFIGKKKHKKTQHVHRTAIQPPVRRKHPVVDHGRRVAGFIHRCGEHRDPNRTFYLLLFFSLSIIFFRLFLLLPESARRFIFLPSSFFFLLLLSLERRRNARIFEKKETKKKSEKPSLSFSRTKRRERERERRA